MKFTKQIVRRKIAGQSMLIPIGDMTSKYNGLFTLTDTGDLIVESISEGFEQEEIVKRILDKYDIDEESARNDVAEFISVLKEYGLLSD